MLAIELAWQTVGTAGVADTVVHAWLAELLTNPVWGVVQYAKITAVKAILDIAELHRQAARGDMPAIAAWDAADRAARAMGDTSNAAGAFAIRAHARAAADAAAGRTLELAGQAIRSWRHLAGLDNSANEATAVNNRSEVASRAEFVLAR